MKKTIVLTLALITIFSSFAQKKVAENVKKTSTKTPVVTKPQPIKSTIKMTNQLKKEDGIYATFTTSKGEIVIKLEDKKTPMTVANFVGLAEGTMENTAKPLGTPFYDGLKFHRVITIGNGDAQDFMVQGGDPQGTGAGGPGYQFPDEFDPSLKHDAPGMLSMANAGPGTNGSQFFITVVATPWLDGKHSIFGKVISGMDIVNKLKQNDVIEKVKIDRIGTAAKAFKADKSIINAAIAKAEEKRNSSMSTDKMEFTKFVQSKYPNAITLPSGLAYIMEKVGTGPNAKAGDKVSVHYNGTLTDGSKFDNSYERNEPITFPLGQKMVIAGWEEGIALLNTGAKAKLIIPYWLAYGVDGRAPVIPAKATLIFDTELMKIDK